MRIQHNGAWINVDEEVANPWNVQQRQESGNAGKNPPLHQREVTATAINAPWPGLSHARLGFVISSVLAFLEVAAYVFWLFHLTSCSAPFSRATKVYSGRGSRHCYAIKWLRKLHAPISVLSGVAEMSPNLSYLTDLQKSTARSNVLPLSTARPKRS